MACNASKTPFLRFVATRGYAAQSSPKAAAKASEVQTTTLPNKLVVATAESDLPISRVSILFRAGSRNESYENMGASHMLRICAGQTTKCSSGFSIVRHLDKVGGSLSVSSDREVVSYTVETTSDHLETGLSNLQDVATGPAFKPWELNDSLPRLRVQIASVPKQVRSVELLHKAAFRTGLGNSVYCPKYHVGKLSSETLQHFFANTCTTNRCAVVGVGVDHNLLVGYAQNFDLESGAGKEGSSKYHGDGEIRKDRSSNMAHVAIGGEGASLANIKEALAFAVLQHALGAGASAKRGNINGALGKAVSAAVGDAPTSVAALNASYTDNGLFGVVLTTDGRVAGKAIDAAVKVLKSGSVSSEDVNRGKAILKAAVLAQHDSDSGLLADIGLQAVLLGQVQNANALAAAIDGISASDVQAAAKKVACSKLSMGAVGNLANVPYLSDLC